MIRKVGISLKYKFVILIAILLLFTMGFYLNYAVNIFKEDKAADIYSITLNNSISIAERLRLIINEESNFLDQLELNESNLNSKFENLFKIHDEIFGIQCIDDRNNFINFFNEPKISDFSSTFESNKIQDYRSLLFFDLSKTRILISPIKGLPNHFSIIKKLKKNSACAIHVSIEKLMPLMNETLNYGSYILNESGQLFFKLNDVNISKNINSIFKDKNILKANQGVKKIQFENKNIVLAYSKIAGLNLISFTEIEEKKAFLASELLIQKSFYFGLLILSMAIIVGIVFSRRMTNSLKILFEANIELSKGNFNIAPIIKSNDEIGALSDSFIDMKDKIIHFMAEMKEKARIESEVQVAKLVQDSFFPKPFFARNNIEFFGLYHPATECSGDWWGYLEQENKVTIITCDATGHGVPAALITAAAHSSITTLKLESSNTYFSPAMILDRLNKVISSLNTEILMTAFVLEIDYQNNQIKYSNASHMPPYLISKKENIYNKESVHPLIENNGPRVGENFNSKYNENSKTLIPGDRIILFSDGILEAKNEEKVFGQRNLIKSILNIIESNSKKIVNTILDDLITFKGNKIFEDDLTLICVNFDDHFTFIPSEFEPNQKILPSSVKVISACENEKNIKILQKNNEINHLIGKNSLDFERELELINLFNEIEKIDLNLIFKDFKNSNKMDLTSNTQIKSTIESQIDNFKNKMTGSINEESIGLVCNEMLSNAFYHSGGNPSFQRGTEVQLIDNHKINFYFFDNEKFFVIATEGPSPFPSKNRIIDSIARASQDRTPLPGEFGAGLGLYLVFDSCSQLWIINTERDTGIAICIFEKFNRNKLAKERITSFHFVDRSK